MNNLFKITTIEDSNKVEAAEFAQFNRGPHLCVEVPDAISTISVRTSEGNKITFSFLPYREGGPPKCVDIQHHSIQTTVNDTNGKRLPVQEVIVFGYKKEDIHIKRADGYFITCVVLEENDN